MSKEQEILSFLDEHVFNPAMNHPAATPELRAEVMMTRLRLAQRDAAGMRLYFWTSVVGTSQDGQFASRLRSLGMTRFEDVVDEFRDRFDDDWLMRPE